MRRNGALAADYARRHGVPRWHDDADAIIRAPDIDAVYVATTPDTHRDYVLRCAAAGKPVLVEKPMAMDRRAMRRDDRRCAAAPACRCGSPTTGARCRASSRCAISCSAARSAPVRMVTSRQFQPLRAPADMNPGSPPWRIDAARSGGGLFVDMVSHTLDFLDFVFGPIEKVRAFAGNQAGAYRPEDVVTASYRFASGRLRQRRVLLRRRSRRGMERDRRRARDASGSRRRKAGPDPRHARRCRRGNSRSTIRRTCTSR